MGLVWYVGKKVYEKGWGDLEFIQDFWEMQNSHLESGGKEWKKKHVLCV